MRTIVYVDGFNLYFRLLASRPSLKWLDIKKLAETLLNPQNKIVGIKYFTALCPAEPMRMRQPVSKFI